MQSKLILNTANCRQARHHRSRRAGAAMHGHRSGTSSIMEPGVANREGKGAIQMAENEKSHSQNSANPPGADHKVGARDAKSPAKERG